MELVTYRAGEASLLVRDAFQIRPGQGGVTVSAE